MELESIINVAKIRYIKNLINELKENNKADNSDKIIESLEIIKKKYYVLNNKLSDSDSSQSIEKIKKPKIDETNALHFSDDSKLEFSDDYLYKRPWTKLSNIHKAIKMKEFVQKLIIRKNEDRDKLKETLLELINSKVLTKKDMVKYDSVNGRIIGIPCLSFSNGRYYVVL